MILVNGVSPKNTPTLFGSSKMKMCTVQLIRDPNIERLVKNVQPLARKSKRLMEMAKMNGQDVGKVTISIKSVNENAPRRRMPIAANRYATNSAIASTSHLRPRSKSFALDVPVVEDSAKKRNDSPASKRALFSKDLAIRAPTGNDSSIDSMSVAASQATYTPKSAIGHKSRLRLRSRSVTFDLDVAEENSASGSFSADNGRQTPVENEVLNDSTNRSNNTSSAANQNDSSGTNLSSGQVLAYENRIDRLVKSNQAKIGRIQALQKERDTLLVQVGDIHRINLTLTQTVDMYRAQPTDENAVRTKDKEVADLKKAYAESQKRGDQLHSAKCNLEAENLRLKACLGTFSKRVVLAEHNYNL